MVEACMLEQLGDEPLAVTVNDRELAIVRVGEEIFAIDDECTHGRIKLSDGDVEGCTIECWRHGARFDLRTGAALDLPATEPVRAYPTAVEAGRVLVDLDNPVKTTEKNSAAAAAADKEN